jgi:formamidopyrimidine-DNA glycosylase
MDGKQVVGVGNIYANEALFMAGIHPHRQAGRISTVRLGQLVASCKEVLSAAIQQGGTTLRDFVDSEGKPGYFKQQLQVYGRTGQACVTCDQPLIESRLGQRSTVYCKRCQR